MRGLAWLVVVVAACTSETKPCLPTGAAGIADQLLRDPATGQCQSFGIPCDPACGQACPAVGAEPDWGACDGLCESLTESQCLASPTCHATYQDSPTPAPLFWQCWELPPSGAITGACDGLDAQTCSEHTDCTSLYTSAVNQGSNFVPSFESCHAEPAQSCATVDCGPNNLCVVTPDMPTTAQCEPTASAGSCTGRTCAAPPPACPNGTIPGIDATGCYTGFCIPTTECTAAPCASLATETACLARTDCDAVYIGSNCTCDKNGCVCQTETYDHCQ
jgi:hypothetical protein